MFNCGMMAVELGSEDINRLFEKFAGKETTLSTDMDNKLFRFTADGDEESLPFSISEFDQALVEAGGWVGYADANY